MEHECWGLRYKDVVIASSQHRYHHLYFLRRKPRLKDIILLSQSYLGSKWWSQNSKPRHSELRRTVLLLLNCAVITAVTQQSNMSINESTLSDYKLQEVRSITYSKVLKIFYCLAHLPLNSFGFKTPNSLFTGTFKCFLTMCFTRCVKRSKYVFHFFVSLGGPNASHHSLMSPN